MNVICILIEFVYYSGYSGNFYEYNEFVYLKRLEIDVLSKIINSNKT